MIRIGTFISNAVARSKEAKPQHALYPFPQSEVDANPNLVQIDGY